MQQSVEHFVWGYQEAFRLDIEFAAGNLLKELGVELDPNTFLVAIRVDDAGPEFKKGCVVPETGLWLKSSAIYDLLNIADRIQAESNDNAIIYSSSQGVIDRYRRQVHLASIRSAISEHIESAEDKPANIQFFISPPADRPPYAVFTVIAVSAPALKTLPRFDQSTLSPGQTHRYIVPANLVEACLQVLLERASASVTQQDAGAESMLSRNTDDLLRAGGLKLFAGLLERIEPNNSVWTVFQSTYLALAKCAARTYEGANAAGHLLMCGLSFAGAETLLEFKEAIPLHDDRALRKLLEITNDEVALRCSATVAGGLTRMKRSAPASNERYLEIKFRGRGRWEVSFNGIALMSVQDYYPSIPKSELDRPHLGDSLRRIFPAITSNSASQIIDAVEESVAERHGLLVVISEHAETEAKRLEGEGFAIAPTELDPSLVSKLTLIDGAVIYSPDARCHAIGVILDGTASTRGNKARGARFNSAARYVSTQKAPCLAIVVSEDGGVTVLPELKPQIGRSAIEDQLRDLESLVATGTGDAKRRELLVQWFEHHQYYLSGEQCDRANAAIAKSDQLHLIEEPSGWHAVRWPLKPDPDFRPDRDLS
jgi:hypothetical protein